MLSHLIAKHCPDGVEYESIGNAFRVLATARGVKRSAYREGSLIPIVDQGRELIAGHTDLECLAVPDGAYVVFGDHTRAVKWVDFKFAPGADGTKVLRARDGLLPKFAYYALANLDIPDRGYNRHWTVLREMRIPVPPVEVQREIVRILDHFTELEAKLEAELQAELEARGRQYDLVTASMLDFDINCAVTWSTLGEVSNRVSSGATPLAGKSTYYDGGTIPWLRTQEVRFTDIWRTEVKVTELAIRETAAKWIPANCVIVAISGATAGRSAVNRIPLTTNQHCCNFEINPHVADVRYVWHCVRFQYRNLRGQGQGARSDLNSGIIKRLPIPVLPLDRQRAIAATLDKFDALINDLNVGLPAELAARRKQYEFYRDKLLTFEERL